MFSKENKNNYTVNRPALNFDTRNDTHTEKKFFSNNSPTKTRKNYLVNVHTRSSSNRDNLFTSFNLNKKRNTQTKFSSAIEPDEIASYKKGKVGF